MHMNGSLGEMTMEGLAARLAELEHANTQLHQELALLRAVKPPISESVTPPREGSRTKSRVPNLKTPSSISKSRRKLLRQGLEAAAAGVGAGALLELSTGSVHAFAPADNPGNFSSSNSSISAVTATGTIGADGVSALSDTGAGISGSGGGYGIFGNCLGSSGYGVYGVNSSGGIGVYADSNSGGTALVVNGTMRVQGNAVGQATLLTSKTSVTVTTSAATTSSNIVLTPLNKYKGIVWVTRASGSFIINASVAQTSNVVFTYLIIN